MTRNHQTLLRSCLCLALGAAACLPLRAQLDPRLQGSKTDFTDLYQQSASLKARPEILTVFDYSGSMMSLMNHPLYRNNDNADGDPYRTMRFRLTNGAAGAAPNNTYTIRARAANCRNATSTYKVTVSSTGAVGVAAAAPTTDSCLATTTAPTYTITARAAGNTNAYATVTFSPAGSGANPNYSLTGNGNSGTKTNSLGSFTITHSGGSTTPAPTIELNSTSGPTGTVITMTAYLTHPPAPVQEPPLPDNNNISWSINNGGSVSAGATTVFTAGLRYRSVATWTIPPFTPTTDDATRLRAISVSPGSPFASGATLNFSTYFRTRGSSDRINWTVEKGTGNQCDAGYSTITPGYTTGNTTAAPGGTVAWKIPSYCNVSGPPAGSYVTVSLDPRAGSSPVSGVTYLTSTLSARTDTVNYEALRKPDGTPVTQADADNASTTSGLRGASVSPRSTDVRNWIRAASHVRFRANVGGGVYRTIDIPIPWKIIEPSSTANPLESQTEFDRQIKKTYATDGTPITLNYGSGSQIEMDLNYRIEASAGGVFASEPFVSDNGAASYDGNALGTGATTDAYLYSVQYRPAYVSWLFTGKYQSSNANNPNYTPDSSLAGKYIIFDADKTNLAANQGSVSWGQGYGPTGNWGDIPVPRYNTDGSYRDSVSEEASTYRIPDRTRLQATKIAAIKTWISHQADVWWAFRCLSPGGEAGTTDINNNSNASLTAGDPTTTHINGTDSGWTVLNNTAAQGIDSPSGNSVTGMNRIASMFAKGGTPLTYAMARGLAQYTDPNSVFNAVVGSEVSQCVNHYLLLFTDGLDNNGTNTLNGNTTTPYITGTGSGAALDALAGNRALINQTTGAISSQINRYGSYWNLFTFAGMAAHLSDPSFGTINRDYVAALDPGTTTTSGTPSSFAPFALKKRNGVTFDKDQRITIMTVGVSLGGKYTDSSSPKRSLFLGAVCGDPTIKSGALNSFRGFDGRKAASPSPDNDWEPKPGEESNYPDSGRRKSGAVYFFDATTATKLLDAMEVIFLIATNDKIKSSTANPNMPFVGASFGKQLYSGVFEPSTTPSAVWSGDLLMFGTREVNGVTQIVDRDGNQATELNTGTAQWSAREALELSRKWYDRKLYTRLPNATALKLFKDTGVDYDDNTNGLKNFVAKAKPVGSAAQKAVIQFVAGGDTIKGPFDTDGRPTVNRKNLMGDIINSAPAALEYKWSDVVGSLTPRLAAVTGANRFRLILVGTNQGWVHAFGEVTKIEKIPEGQPNAGQEMVTGAVDELWSFLPTDFLENLDYITNDGNLHRFMSDGTPGLYHLDLPSAAGPGNGVVDVATERAIAVFGLRKGGRSYYALDIHNPFSPSLKWSLVPDEAATFSNTIAGGPTAGVVQPILEKMGFSSCTPAFGRIQFGEGASAVIKDAVFLGGGASVPQIEHNFPVYPPPAMQATKLGRSILALDVYTGAVLAAQDLTSASIGGDTVGPVSNGVVPFEFILNSGMAQRAYFLDYSGGLWAWGSKAVYAAAPYQDFRIDTSSIKDWSVRKVYQDSSTGGNPRYSTVPAPFRVGTFTGKSITLGGASPAAVGIAMVSGDRNNPLDQSYNTTTDLCPTKHRLTVVFDRQDSRAWSLDTASGPDLGITDTKLANFTPASAVTSTPAVSCSDSLFKLITPGCPDYYLAPSSGTPKFGYYVNFPGISNNFVSKGINPPLVVSGNLFYNYFTPTKADPCKGGTGDSYSWVITDVLNPIVNDGRTELTRRSGLIDTWNGVASDFIAKGTRGVIQGGVVSVNNPQPGGSLTTPEIHTTLVGGGQRFPKPRVWRTVQGMNP